MAYIDYGEQKGVSVILENHDYKFTVDVLNFRNVEYAGSSEEQTIYGEYMEIEKAYEIKTDSVNRQYQKAANSEDQSWVKRERETIV